MSIPVDNNETTTRPERASAGTGTDGTGTGGTGTGGTGTGGTGTGGTGTGGTGTGGTGTGGTGTGGTAEGITAKEAEIKAHVDAITKLADVPEGIDTGKKIPHVSNPYGKQTSSFGLGAALTVEGCPGPFQLVPGLGARLRRNSTEFEVLVRTKVMLTALLRGVSMSLGQATGQLVDDIGLTINIRDTTMNNRGGDPQVQAQMDRASQLLEQLRGGRAAGKASKAKDTKAADANLASADSTINKQDLTIKYLQGEELKPEDLTGGPAATPSGSRRGVKAPASTKNAGAARAPRNPKR